MRSLIVGSRGSALALEQTGRVVNQLRSLFPGLDLTIETSQTLGDRVSDRPLSQFGATGVFVRDLADLLRVSKIDLAVHSLKDVPPVEDRDLVLAAFPEREDPRDVLLSRDGRRFLDLQAGDRVGTSSTRRRAQLRARRPDLIYCDGIRGNVDTRIRKLREGQFDAIILAAAGLIRLGRQPEISEYLPLDVCLPDAGQGTLAVQARAADGDVRDLLARIDDHLVRACALAERSLLQAFNGGCSVPVAAYAQIVDEHILLQALVAAPDGSKIIRAQATGPLTEPSLLGREVWASLVAAGAWNLLAGTSDA